MKPCTRCGKTKALDDFYVDRNSPDGRTYVCKDCGRARSAEWKAAHPEKVREHAKRFYAKNVTRQPILSGAKTCSACHQEKPITEFYISRKAADGRQHRCKDCSKAAATEWNQTHREQYNENARSFRTIHGEELNAERNQRKAEDETYRRAVKEQHRRLHLSSRYGMSLEEFDELVERQGGLCAICRTAPKGGRWDNKWHVDHDHTTGAVRGLLCHGCNTGLGSFGDSIALLEAATRYLTLHAAVS